MKLNKLNWQHLAILLCLIYVIILYRNAWIGDDAYITFRTVDNFINGFGLTWNVTERVQAYTHPLWMFLISSIYWITREVFYSSIFLSIIISVLTVCLLAFRMAKSSYVSCIAVIAFILSKAFIDYSTSGLENPLSHLLAVIFFMVFLTRPLEKKTIIILSLIAALAGLNRMDCLLIYFPVFVYLLWKDFRLRNLAYIFLGFLPLLIWELFSLFYYGFLFSNTAYAKLSACVTRTDLIEQGLYYIWSSVKVDPVTIIIIIAGIIIPLVTKKWRLLLITGGVILYLLYVVWIGGCFMSGRFLTIPFILSVIILSQYRFERPNAGWWLPGIIILIVGLSVKLSPVYTNAEYGIDDQYGNFGGGVVDERGCYCQSSSLLNISKDEPMPAHRYARLGRTQRIPITIRSTIGYYGYYAGPDTYIIDLYGLANPLLARLPCDTTMTWRIGHNIKAVPEGYPETILSGKNLIKDKKIAAYYEKLSFIVSGDLFNWDRIVTILKFNLGFYNLE
ncbi:MAG: hypothetical protein ABIJ12_07965 [bacterium]